jgi:hypothetical protein
MAAMRSVLLRVWQAGSRAKLMSKVDINNKVFVLRFIIFLQMIMEAKVGLIIEEYSLQKAVTNFLQA